MRTLLLVLTIGIIVSAPCMADVVKWVDENGNVHFGESAPPQYVESAVKVEVAPANISDSPPPPSPMTTSKKKKKSHSNKNKNTKGEPKTKPNLYTNENICQKKYGLSCAELNNWKENGTAHCTERNGGKKCNNPKYIETKYKPKTLKEKHLQAARNANRRREEENQKDND